MSIGEDRVRVKFNPSGDGLVDQLQQKTAALINLCAEQLDSERSNPNTNASEIARLWALAMTHYEDAAMWAVKAATA